MTKEANTQLRESALDFVNKLRAMRTVQLPTDMSINAVQYNTADADMCKWYQTERGITRCEVYHDQEAKNREICLTHIDMVDVCMSFLITMLSEVLGKVTDIVRNSGKIEWRYEYKILRDYSREPDTLTACYTIDRDRKKAEAAVYEMYKRNRRVSLGGNRNTHDMLFDRVEYMFDHSSKLYDTMRHEVIRSAKQFKISDPNAFYPIVYAVYVASQFNMMRTLLVNSVDGIGYHMDKSISRYNPVADLMRLLNRCHFTRRDDKPIRWIYSQDEHDAYLKEMQTSRWKRKHGANPPEIIHITNCFDGWELYKAHNAVERYVMSYENFDLMNRRLLDLPTKLHELIGFGHLVSGIDTPEQSYIISMVRNKMWEYAPASIDKFLTLIEDRKRKRGGKMENPDIVYYVDKNDGSLSLFSLFISGNEAKRYCCLSDREYDYLRRHPGKTLQDRLLHIPFGIIFRVWLSAFVDHLPDVALEMATVYDRHRYLLDHYKQEHIHHPTDDLDHFGETSRIADLYLSQTLLNGLQKPVTPMPR